TTQGPRILPDTVKTGSTLDAAPSLKWVTTGEQVNWSTDLGPRATALVLLHPGCATCYVVAGELDRVAQAQVPGVKVIAVVTTTSSKRGRQFFSDAKLSTDNALLEVQRPE